MLRVLVARVQGAELDGDAVVAAFVATRMFGALAEKSININLINTSEVRINVGTDIAQGKAGLDCLKEAFSLTD